MGEDRHGLSVTLQEEGADGTVCLKPFLPFSRVVQEAHCTWRGGEGRGGREGELKLPEQRIEGGENES